MKKIMLSTVALICTVATLYAQSDDVSQNKDIKKLNNDEKTIKKEKKEERKELRKLKGKEVSYQSKQSFFEDFGDVADVSWERTAYFDEAIFMKGGIKITAFYDEDSKLVGTTSPKTFADLPTPAQKHITKKYPDYDIEKVIFFDDNEYNETDMYIYGTQLDDEDNYFVELKKDNKEIVLQVDMSGNVFFFKDIK